MGGKQPALSVQAAVWVACHATVNKIQKVETLTCEDLNI